MAYGTDVGNLGQSATAGELEQLAEAPGLPFRDLLSMDRVMAALESAKRVFRQRVFDPVTVFWAWLSQVLSADGSCQQAVHRVNAQRVADGRPAASSDTSSYCEARQRLPLSVVQALTRQIGATLHDRAPEAWLGNGGSIKLVDGTTVDMMDTPANREVYSQPGGQKPGLGFPIVRLVGIFSLAVGAVLEMALGASKGKGTGEQSLFRGLDDAFAPGDIALADRLYDSYHDIALLQQRGVDVIFGSHVTRRVDFRRGRLLGLEDHVVTWPWPRFHAARLDRRTHDRLPETLQMRELRARLVEPGFRPQQITIVTTLTDAAAFPKEEIAAVFRLRWHVELNLRSLKTMLGMRTINCKSPAMVEKAIWMHMLAYNLVRAKMAQAALTHGLAPIQLSFQNARQAMRTYGDKMAGADPDTAAALHAALLAAIAHVRVGDRPNRVEPRAVKRRKTKYPYLKKPRNQKTSKRAVA